MNPTIRELAEQSGFFPVPDETETDWEYRAENARYEHFAERVVSECIRLLTTQNYIGGYRARTELLNHFGLTNTVSLVPNQATELEWLQYFFENADFGPAHEDVMMGIADQFEEDTGKILPDGY